MTQLLDKITRLTKTQRLELLEILKQPQTSTQETIQKKEDALDTDSDNDNFIQPTTFPHQYPLEDYYLTIEQWGKGENFNLPEIDIYNLFVNNAQRYLNKTAITMGTDSITYGQLIDKVELLSAFLSLKYSLPIESRVVVYLPRSIDMIVAILAILKLGCAYVPIDATHPSDRVQKIIDNSQPTLIITDSSILSINKSSSKVFLLNKDFNASDNSPTQTTSLHISPETLAYIIYTSGTTGEPKGVMIEQRSVINFILSMQRVFEINYLDRVIFFASIGFDVSVFEIFTTLISGAELVIAGDDERISPMLLSRFLHKTKITVAELPPAILPLLHPEDFPCLRLLSVGGERFSENVIRPWLNPDRRIINGYGPTEGTVAVVLYEYRGKRETIPAIGKPIANHSAYVITKDNQFAEIGAIGELYISGCGLARGYYNQVELTNEKFISLTVSGKDIRAYKTGDLARWRQDGNLEIIGRVDRQVKIRGHRVELGEIETLLLSHPNITQVAVNYEKRQDDQSILVAYIVTDDASLLSTDIYVWVARKLPAYMVPANILFIESVPLTANGKIDYKSLTKIPIPFASTSLKHIEPLNNTQLIIQKIFTKHLGNSSIGLHDNFFYMGGDSLLAAKVANEIIKAFDYPLKMMDFLQSPTIYELSTIINNNKNQHTYSQRLDSVLEHIRSPWVVMKENEDANKYLVYFHCAGGSASKISQWQKKLDPSIQIVGIQLPAHDQRLDEAPIDNIERLAELITPELEHLFSKPVYLMGHSMGALLAYAVCQNLVLKNLYPQALIVIASRAPQELYKKFFEDGLSDEFFLHKMQIFGELSNEVLNNKDLISSLLPGMRADVKASEAYICNNKLSIPIITLIGKNDKISPPKVVLAWEAVASGKFEKLYFDGGHFFVQEQEKDFISKLNSLLT